MADIITQNNYVTIKIPLRRGTDETAVRNITMPNPIDNAITLKTALNSLINRFKERTNMLYLFQPSNWRDTDTAEEAWQITDWEDVTVELTQTTKTEIDASE